jgi:hypothetical protein
MFILSPLARKLAVLTLLILVTLWDRNIFWLRGNVSPAEYLIMCIGKGPRRAHRRPSHASLGRGVTSSQRPNI